MTKKNYIIPLEKNWPIIIHIPNESGHLYTRVAHNEDEFIKYANELQNELKKNNIIYNCDFNDILKCLST